jgi:protein arginine N-methyltransferase 6
MQDVEIDEEVDVIISEWMGYMLLYEVHIRILLIF